MNTKKILILFACILLYQWGPAQGKLSWYYPKLDEVSPRSGKNGSYMLNMHGVSGCVSGNCKSGYGEYLKAYPADTVLPSMAVNPVMLLTIYKGQFSNDGKNFEGTVFSRKVYYDIVYKKDDPLLVPKLKEDLKSETFWKPFEIASGTMVKAGSYDYRWEGWMNAAITPGSNPAPGQVSSFKAHFIDDKVHIKRQFAPGGVYTSLEGKALKNGEFLGGRIRFSDGSIYEGFIHKGKRFGPGRYTTQDGKTEEGIWMLDSLALATPVGLPKDLFEPVLNAPVVARMAFGGFRELEFMDAGKGWVYSFNTNAFYLGKWENGKLNGPGFMVSEDFRTGIFSDGKLVSGMKLSDDVYSGGRITTSISGEFKDDQIKPSCSKMIRYDAKGKPVYMVEGYFYPSQNFKKEFADGWAYVNDWEGRREAVNLQYMYTGENYLVMNGASNYISWFEKGLKESGSAIFCFPSMKAQSASVLSLMKQRHDSVLVFAKKLEADIAAYKANWGKAAAEREATCATERAKYPYVVGDLFHVGDGFDPEKFLIIGSMNCYFKTFPVYKRHWVQSTRNKGYWKVTSINLSEAEIKKAKKIASAQGVCGNCGGTGTKTITEYHDVGGNSGYTHVGGGWAVKNPETYWKSETAVICKSCSGKGFGPSK